MAAELVAEEGAAGLPLRLVEQPEGGLRFARETVVAHRAHQGLRRAGCYDAFGVIGTTFRELDWKMLIFFERAAPITPNMWWSARAGRACSRVRQASSRSKPMPRSAASDSGSTCRAPSLKGDPGA